ncbi:MAG: YciI family protein [Pseudomonadota bacterium]
MRKTVLAAAALWLTLCAGACRAQQPSEAPKPAYDPALARAVGADERGMRSYVLVVLKTGPNRVPPGPERDEMFKGHFANMKRLSTEGKLVLAGPFDGVDGWRGLFIFAATEIDEAKQFVATDPVVIKGEMVPEFHKYYGTAALMLVRDLSEKVARKPM